MMGKFSRDKGRRWEIQSANIAKAWLLEATADGWKQCKDGDDTYSDVQIKPMRSNIALRVECKHHENHPSRFWKWLKGHDVIFLKRNHKIPLAVLPLTDYLELIGGVKPTEESECS
jgi:hypothetical protein